MVASNCYNPTSKLVEATNYSISWSNVSNSTVKNNSIFTVS